MASIASRKKLSALFDRGVEVRFVPNGAPLIGKPDENGGKVDPDRPVGDEDVQVWVAPPNPYQRDMAMRDAQAARARALLRVKNDPESEEQLSAKAYLADMSFETLVDYLVLTEQEQRTGEAIRNVLATEEWKDFDELRDSMRHYQDAIEEYVENGREGDNPDDDPEWQALLEAERHYQHQVVDRQRELEEGSRESMRLLPREELEKRALEKRGEISASQAFVIEYENRMKFYSVRDFDKHDALWFENVKELMESPEQVQVAIGAALKTMISENGEAKN